jgi:hypothetical protein
VILEILHLPVEFPRGFLPDDTVELVFKIQQRWFAAGLECFHGFRRGGAIEFLVNFVLVDRDLAQAGKGDLDFGDMVPTTAGHNVIRVALEGLVEAVPHVRITREQLGVHRHIGLNPAYQN